MSYSPKARNWSPVREDNISGSTFDSDNIFPETDNVRSRKYNLLDKGMMVRRFAFIVEQETKVAIVALILTGKL